MNQSINSNNEINRQPVIRHLRLADILLVFVPVAVVIGFGIADGRGIGDMMGLAYFGLLISVILSVFYFSFAFILAVLTYRNRTFRIILGGVLLLFAVGFYVL